MFDLSPQMWEPGFKSLVCLIWGERERDCLFHSGAEWRGVNFHKSWWDQNTISHSVLFIIRGREISAAALAQLQHSTVTRSEFINSCTLNSMHLILYYKLCTGFAEVLSASPVHLDLLWEVSISLWPL